MSDIVSEFRCACGDATLPDLLHGHTECLNRRTQVPGLDPGDPFEAAIIDMVETYRRKRADYASDTDQWSNFKDMARVAGCPPWMAALVMCQQKLSRVIALRDNGRLDDPRNESVSDTVEDNAVYAVIALAIMRGGR